MPYGLTPEGYVRKPLEVWRAELEAEVKARFGPKTNVSESSIFGQFIGIAADKFAQLDEVAEAIYTSQDPDKAVGDAQDALAALTGTLRRGATRSRVLAQVDLDDGTDIEVGEAIASVEGNPTARFRNAEPMVNDTGSSGEFDVWFEAEETGPVVANSGTLTVIETNLSGWNEIDNEEDAELGREIESPADLRVRREEELRQQGGSTLPAIRSALFLVDGVEAVTIHENYEEHTVDGIPPKSFEAVVLGGDDEDVAQQIWRQKPAGIRTHGDTEVVIEDDDGNPQTVRFTRPSVLEVYLVIQRTTYPADYPSDGDDQIRHAVAQFAGSEFSIGNDVILSRLYGPTFSVSGVRDVLEIRAGLSPAPSGTSNLSVDPRSIAVFETGRITVTS